MSDQIATDRQQTTDAFVTQQLSLVSEPKYITVKVESAEDEYVWYHSLIGKKLTVEDVGHGLYLLKMTNKEITAQGPKFLKQTDCKVI